MEVTAHRPTIHRTVCPACGHVVTAMSEAALFHGLMTHQEIHEPACSRGPYFLSLQSQGSTFRFSAVVDGTTWPV